MKIFIDTADVTVIKRLYGKYHFDGVTTNPRLLAKMQGKPMELLQEIRQEIPAEAELHVQVVSLKADEMIKEAEHILKVLGSDVHIKVPVSEEGYQVIRYLAEKKVSVTATTIFHPIQALLAAESGAASVAPYVRQISNKSSDGVIVAKEIQRLLDINGYQTELLAAAFESVHQVTEIAAFGAKSVTVAPEILMEMLVNGFTENAVKSFYEEFKSNFKQENMLSNN